jgi:hypothetical protein
MHMFTNLFIEKNGMNFISKAVSDTWDWQDNGKSCERFTLLSQYGVGPPSACNTACIPLGIDSYQFWIFSSGIIYRSSCGTSSICLRNDGVGNLLLALLSKTDHIGLAIVLAGEHVEVQFHVPETSLSSVGLRILAFCFTSIRTVTKHSL